MEEALNLVHKYKDVPPGEWRLSPEERDQYAKIDQLSPQEIAVLLEEFDLSKDQNNFFVIEALRILAKKDPALFCSLLPKLGGIPAGFAAFEMTTAVESDPKAVQTWLSKGEISTNTSILLSKQLLDALSGSDPRRAVEFLTKEGTKQFQLLNMSYVDWGRQDPEAAIAYMKKNLSAADQKTFSVPVIFSAAIVDAAHAYEIAQSIDNGMRDGDYARLFAFWVEQDSTGAAKALEEVPPEKLKNVLTQMDLVEGLAQKNPEGLLSVMSGVVFTESSKALFERVAVAVSQSDPEEARNWISNLPDSPAKEEILAKISK